MKKNGISFKGKNDFCSYMKIIMKNVDTSNYKYNIQGCEVYDMKNQNIFKNIDTKIDYIKILKNMDEYYSIFFEVFLFTKDPKNIKEDKDYFLNDDVKIAFLNVDVDEYYIFVKDFKILEKIYNNVKNSNEFYDLEYIENLEYWS